MGFCVAGIFPFAYLNRFVRTGIFVRSTQNYFPHPRSNGTSRRRVCHTSRRGGDKLLLCRLGQSDQAAAGCNNFGAEEGAVRSEQLPALRRARPVRMRGPPPSAGPNRGRRVLASAARRRKAPSGGWGGAEPGSGGGPGRAGEDSGESDAGLTERGGG